MARSSQQSELASFGKHAFVGVLATVAIGLIAGIATFFLAPVQSFLVSLVLAIVLGLVFAWVTWFIVVGTLFARVYQ